jgi:SPP1 gp7 family putative phage head morphogenesis protein
MPDQLDALTRHQIYVEGYKNYETIQAEATVDEIIAAVVLLMVKLKVIKLSELTRQQFLVFLRAVNSEIRTLFGKYADVKASDLRKFFLADLDVTTALLGADYLGSVERLYGTIRNAPVAGVGVEPEPLLTNNANAIVADVTQALKRGFADNLEITAVIAALVGTAEYKFRNGEAAKIKRRLATALDTVIQHVTSEVQFTVGRLVSDRYRWCSVLDSRTTDICRERHGLMFYYGDGPRPPAHYRCRSFTEPVTGAMSVDDLPTFYTWVRRQPAEIQDDVLGPARGRDLRKGLLGSGDLPGFDRARPLTVEQYKAKLPQMLKEVA